MEVALAGAAVAGEHRHHPGLAPQAAGQSEAVGHGEHGAEVADHPDDAVLERAEVEAPVPAGGEAALPAEELAQESVEVDAPAGEDAEVAVQRQHEVVLVEGRHDPDGDGLLPDTREPLRQAALAEQPQHLLLHQARQEQCPVEPGQAVVVETRRGRVGGGERFGHLGQERRRRSASSGGAA